MPPFDANDPADRLLFEATLLAMENTGHPLVPKLKKFFETHLFNPPAHGDPPGPHLSGEDMEEFLGWCSEHNDEIGRAVERLRRAEGNVNFEH